MVAEMNNIDVKRKNFKKFKHAGVCGCVACQLSRRTITVPAVKVDYFDPEDYQDDDGWF